MASIQTRTSRWWCSTGAPSQSWRERSTSKQEVILIEAIYPPLWDVSYGEREKELSHIFIMQTRWKPVTWCTFHYLQSHKGWLVWILEAPKSALLFPAKLGVLMTHGMLKQFRNFSIFSLSFSPQGLAWSSPLISGLPPLGHAISFITRERERTPKFSGGFSILKPIRQALCMRYSSSDCPWWWCLSLPLPHILNYNNLEIKPALCMKHAGPHTIAFWLTAPPPHAKALIFTYFPRVFCHFLLSNRASLTLSRLVCRVLEMGDQDGRTISQITLFTPKPIRMQSYLPSLEAHHHSR